MWQCENERKDARHVDQSHSKGLENKPAKSGKENFG